MLIHGDYLLFYRTVPDTDEGDLEEVSIVRIVKGTRDLTGIIH
jgi:toxin ParE1/3/4